MTSRLAAATAAKPKFSTKTRTGKRRALDLLVISLVSLTAIWPQAWSLCKVPTRTFHH